MIAPMPAPGSRSLPALARPLLTLPLLTLPLLACPSDDDGDEETSFGDLTDEATEDSSGDSTDTTTETEESTEETTSSCEPATTAELFRLLASTSDFPSPLTDNGAAALAVPGPSSIGGGERVYLYVDYELNEQTFTTQFTTLVIDLNDAGCSVNLPVDLFQIEPVDLPVLDSTVDPSAPVTVGAFGTGVNVYELTDLELADDDCVGGVLGSISYAMDGGPYDVAWIYDGQGVELRDLRLYVGDITDGCP